MMIQKKKIIIVMVGILVAAVLIYQYFQARSSELANTIHISGNIEATLVKVSFKILDAFRSAWWMRIRRQAGRSDCEDRGSGADRSEE